MEMSVTNLEKLLEMGPGKRLSYHLGRWGENLKNWDFDAISELYQLSKMLQQYSVKSMHMLQKCPFETRHVWVLMMAASWPEPEVEGKRHILALETNKFKSYNIEDGKDVDTPKAESVEYVFEWVDEYHR